MTPVPEGLSSFIDIPAQENYIKTLASYAPYYEEHVLDGNHLIHMTNPVDTARLITNFVNRDNAMAPETAKTDYSFLGDMGQIPHT